MKKQNSATAKMRKSLFVFWLLSLQLSAFSQNLYNAEHTQQFANYLFNSQQYGFAIQEYERLVFLNKHDSASHLMLLKSYRLGKEYDRGIQSAQQLYGGKLFQIEQVLAAEYTKLLLANGKNTEAYNYLTKNSTLPQKKKADWQLSALLLNQDWNEAYEYSKNKNELQIELVTLSEKAKNQSYKKPALAAFMSAIVPGSGKFYTKNWKDGAIALLFVAANSWQAYRGFNKYGNQSAYGWVFGTIALGFYGGNVYGSYKAAKKYNQQTEHKLYHEASHLIFSDF